MIAWVIAFSAFCNHDRRVPIRDMGVRGGSLKTRDLARPGVSGTTARAAMDNAVPGGGQREGQLP